MGSPFEPFRCFCGDVLGQGVFKGLVLIACHGCGRRVWIGGDGAELRLLRADRPNRRVLTPSGTLPFES